MVWSGFLTAFPALVAAVPQGYGGSGTAMLRFGCSQYVFRGFNLLSGLCWKFKHLSTLS